MSTSSPPPKPPRPVPKVDEAIRAETSLQGFLWAPHGPMTEVRICPDVRLQVVATWPPVAVSNVFALHPRACAPIMRHHARVGWKRGLGTPTSSPYPFAPIRRSVRATSTYHTIIMTPPMPAIAMRTPEEACENVVPTM